MRPSLESELILAQILRDTPVEALGGVIELPGTVTALAALLRQLGESGKVPADLDRVLAHWAAAEPAEGPLANDIRGLAAAFERACADQGLMGRPTAVREAVRAVETWTRPVALYGFTSFTIGQRELIRELSRRTELLLTFTYDHSRAVNLGTPAEMSWWEAMASDTVRVSSPTLAYESPAIAYLEQFFMGDAPRPQPPPAVDERGGVRFLLASGERAEAELAAEQISGLLRSGYPPGEIAVVVRHMGKWSGLLGEVFDSCGIPHQIDDRCSLAETGIGHALLNALKGVVSDDPHAILAYLRSPYSGVPLEEVADLEIGYRKGAAKGARVLARVARNMSLGDVERLWDLARDPDGHVSASGVRLDPGATEVLAVRMLAAGLRGSIVGGREMEQDARAFRAIKKALAALAGMECLEGRLALRALAQVAVGGGPTEAPGAVQVLSVQRARARRFEVVLVLGLVEGEFPGRPDVPSLLSAAQRTRLDAVGGGLFAPVSDQEAALFVSAVSRASRLLLLSARDAEDDGAEAAPSHFWESAKDLLAVGKDDHTVRTLADQVFTLKAAPSAGHYLRACAARGVPPHSTVAMAGSCFPTRPWRRPPSRLTSRMVLAELAAVECFSPSALEAYVNCPFAWFVERVIGIDDIDLRLDGRAIGQLLHGALSSVYHQLRSAGLLPLRPGGVSQARDVASAVIDGLVETDECPGTTAERRVAAWRLKRMAGNLFDMEASAQGKLVLSETETWVGGRRGVDVGGLRIRGRIDRIDADPGGRGLFVFDYKSGSVPSVSAIGTGEGLQLPLYLMALAADRPGTSVLGGAYLALSEKKRSGVVAAGSEDVLGSGTQGYGVLDQDQVESLFCSTRQVALEAAAGMGAGVIAPCRDRSCPSWCSLGPVCRARTGGYRDPPERECL